MTVPSDDGRRAAITAQHHETDLAERHAARDVARAGIVATIHGHGLTGFDFVELRRRSADRRLPAIAGVRESEHLPRVIALRRQSGVDRESTARDELAVLDGDLLDLADDHVDDRHVVVERRDGLMRHIDRCQIDHNRKVVRINRHRLAGVSDEPERPRRIGLRGIGRGDRHGVRATSKRLRSLPRRDRLLFPLDRGRTAARETVRHRMSP